MKRFYHPTDLFADDRVRRLVMRHGAVAYAVMLHVVELAVMSLGRDNIVPTVDHPAEVLADTLRVRAEDPVGVVEDILRSMAMEGIIEIKEDKTITVPFAFTLLDSSLTGNPLLRSVLAGEQKTTKKTVDNHDKQAEYHDIDSKYHDSDLFGDIVKIKPDRRNPAVTEDGRPRPTPAWVVDQFNKRCPGLPRVRVISNKRTEAVRRLTRTFGESEFREAFDEVAASAFLNGKGGRGWRASFDWLMVENNFAKVLEGQYRDVSINDRFNGMGSEDQSSDIFGAGGQNG